jgi:amino acid transporter
VTGVFYLLITCAEMFAAGRHGVGGFIAKPSPLGYLTSRYWSPSVLWTIQLVIFVAGLSFVIAAGNAATRVAFAMGRERVLPGSLARLSRRQTPAAAIGCLAVLTLALGLPFTYADGGTRTFGYLASAGGLAVVLVYLAVIRAFRTEFRDQFRPVPHLLIPAAAVVVFLFPLWGPSARPPTPWSTCCPSPHSAGSASAPSRPRSFGPGAPPASKLSAEHSCQPKKQNSHNDAGAPGWMYRRSSAPGGAGIRGRSYDDCELRQVFWCGRRRWWPGVAGTGAGNDEAEGEGRCG